MLDEKVPAPGTDVGDYDPHKSPRINEDQYSDARQEYRGTVVPSFKRREEDKSASDKAVSYARLPISE